MRKWIKKLFSRSLAYLPAFVRDEIVRRSINLPVDLPENLVFKIAETTDELEASFQLVYQNYLPLGYCQPNEFKLRATIHHALASTTTLLALDHGRVVGTLSVIRDNRLGLPLEKVFDMSALRKNSDRIAEITSLVIDKNYRREKGGLILFPLLRLMYEYSTSYFGVRHLVVSIHPKDAYFYESLLLFKKVPGTEAQNYLGAPAITLHLDLQLALEKYKNIYSNRSAKNNLFYFFVQRKISNVKMPMRQFKKINDPLVTLDYFQKLFVEKLGLQIPDRRNIKNYISSDQSKRMNPRFEVEMQVHVIQISDSSKNQLQGRVRDVSRYGFRAQFDSPFIKTSDIDVQIEVGPKLISHLKAKAIWISPDQGVGFEILVADQAWQDLISFLHKEQTNMAA
jgi:hypothetical protein